VHAAAAPLHYLFARFLRPQAQQTVEQTNYCMGERTLLHATLFYMPPMALKQPEMSTFVFGAQIKYTKTHSFPSCSFSPSNLHSLRSTNLIFVRRRLADKTNIHTLKTYDQRFNPRRQNCALPY